MEKQGRVPAKHHLLIIHTIEKLLRGELGTRKVIMLMPPGSAKSTYTSVLLPAWFLNPEQFPNDLMLACSYSYSLVEGFGREARDMVEEESNVLGTTLSRSAAAAGDWRVSNLRGGYFCGGVGAGIAGHRAKLGLIDDYLGTEQDADSKVVREKTWKWYWNDFLPRLVPGAFEIIIANRRHEEDLVGMLLEKEPQKWTVIRLPMLAEENDPLGRVPGERLWPEWFTEEMVASAKTIPRTWAGLYQQRPAPEEGNFFKANTIVEYAAKDLPSLSELRIYAASDWTVRKEDLNDKAMHLIGGLDRTNRFWILPEVFWESCDSNVFVDKMFELYRKYHPICWWHGRENITGSVGPFIYDKMRAEGVYIPIDELSEAGHMETKAGAIKAMMGARMVMFPGFIDEWSDMKSEILSFPGGKHDDVVATISKFGQGLSGMIRPATVAKPWDGVIEPQKLTGRWLVESSKRRQKELCYN